MSFKKDTVLSKWTFGLCYYTYHMHGLYLRDSYVFKYLWWVLPSLEELFTLIKFITCISFWRSKILLSTFSLEKGRNCSKPSLKWEGNPSVWTFNKTPFLKASVGNWWWHGSVCLLVHGFALHSLHIFHSLNIHL